MESIPFASAFLQSREGGYVDYETAAELKAQWIESYQVLQNSDAYHALQKSNGLIFTGPTGTNVNDVAVALLGYILGIRPRKAQAEYCRVCKLVFAQMFCTTPVFWLNIHRKPCIQKCERKNSKFSVN